jgi:hypothetical protein
MNQRDGLRRQRTRNSRQQVLKIGTVISILALLIAWLGQDELPPEQTIAIALPVKGPSEFELAIANNAPAPAKPASTETAKSPVQTAPATAVIPVATSSKTQEVQAVPAMVPASVSAPSTVHNIASKDIQRINDQAIVLVNEGNPRQAIGLLENALLESKDSGPLFENLRRLYAGFATQSYQLALEPGKPTPVTVELVKTTGETVAVQIASLDMRARNATQALPASTSDLPEMPAKSVLSSDASPAEMVTKDASTVKATQTTVTASSTQSPEVKPTSEVEAEPTSKEPTTAEKVEASRAVMAVVKRWADAWSKKDPDTYIAMYAPHFRPKEMTRAQWEAYRRDRLTKPKAIRVELSDQKAVMLNPNRMRVTFNQMYASDALKANDKKTLELELIDNQWRIILESGR